MKYSRGVQRRRGAGGFRRQRGGRKKSALMSQILTIGIVAFLLWLGWQFIQTISSSIYSQEASAEIEILKGRAEFSLSGTDSWTRSSSGDKFIAGDSIKTSANSRVSLSFLDGNTIFLRDNTELEIGKLQQKSSGEKHIEFELHRGEIWVHATEDALLKNGESSFVLTTPQSRVRVQGTIFDIASNEQEDIIRLVRGNITTEIQTTEAENSAENLSVGVGQKLVINAENKQKISNGDNVLEMTDNGFLESEWHLENLEEFAPEEAAQIRRRIEIESRRQQQTQTVPGTENSDIDSPVILSPNNQTVVPATADSIKIEGTAPADAYQITVNGYTLTKFQPGDRKWTYFASKKFGTLVGGENNYSIVAITRDGQKSPETKLTVNYEGVSAELPQVDTTTSTETTENSAEIPPALLQPTITSPAILLHDAVYETSSSVITIAGNVDQKTVRVVVNNFQLKKFAAGDTKYSYIANAAAGNLKIGENKFSINSYDAEGNVATTNLTVLYKPVNF